MANPLASKFTFNDLRLARNNGRKVAMLTCYDYTTARFMHEAGVPMILVGDSAANVILGHTSTVPVSLSFMIEITAAVRRGAPNALLMGDMPFGSYHSSDQQGVRNVTRMLKLTGCDCIKLEVADGHTSLVKRLSDAGVAVIAHLGLRPQTIGLLGNYRYQGRTAQQAESIVSTAVTMEKAGAAGLLIEAVPAEVGAAVVAATKIPVIGCGAGPACHSSVVVTHDALGLSGHRPRFVPLVSDLSGSVRNAFEEYVRRVSTGEYPAAEHQYEMPVDEAKKFAALTGNVSPVNKVGSKSV